MKVLKKEGKDVKPETAETGKPIPEEKEDEPNIPVKSKAKTLAQR